MSDASFDLNEFGMSRGHVKLVDVVNFRFDCLVDFYSARVESRLSQVYLINAAHNTLYSVLPLHATVLKINTKNTNFNGPLKVFLWL
jgi:hypothetical protein